MTTNEREQFGRYRVEARLGAGGQGTVYRCSDPELGRRVALKAVHRDLTASPTARERFRRELAAATTLEHPNAVRVFDAGETPDGCLYYVMELVEGGDLGARVAAGEPLPPGQVRAVAADVLAALAAMHGRGMVHRDVKPANVILDATGRARLMDFGLVLVEEWTNITAEGEVVGTWRFMPPEVLGGAPADGRSDVYQVGLLAWSLLTGRPPWPALATFGDLLRAQRDGSALVSFPDRPPVPEDLRRWIQRATDPDPARRFASTDEAARGLTSEAARAAARPEARRPAPLARPPSRRPVVAAPLALLGAAALAAAVLRPGAGPADVPARPIAVGEVALAYGSLDAVRVSFATDRPVRSAVLLAAAARPGEERRSVIAAAPTTTHAGLVAGLAHDAVYDQAEVVLADDLGELRRRLPVVEGAGAAARSLASAVVDAEPQRCAAVVYEHLGRGDVGAADQAVDALLASPAGRRLQAFAAVAPAFLASPDVPFAERHALHRALVSLDAVDAVRRERRAPSRLGLEPWLGAFVPTTPLLTRHEGALAYDGFSTPVLLKLREAPKSPVALGARLLVATHFQATPMEGKLRFALDLPSDEFVRARAVELAVWVLELMPADEIRLTVGGHVLSLRSDGRTGRGDELTREAIERLLRERRPEPCSHPFVLRAPTPLFRPGRNELVMSYHRTPRAAHMSYAVPLEVRWRLVPGP